MNKKQHNKIISNAKDTLCESISEFKYKELDVYYNMQMEELHKVLLKNLQEMSFIEQSNKKRLKDDEVDYCNLFIWIKNYILLLNKWTN